MPRRLLSGPYGALEEVPIMSGPARTTETFTREQLVQALDRLQADGRWSPEHAAVLLRELDRSAPPKPPTGPPRTGSRVAEAAGYAGAVLIGAAGAVLVGQQWESLGRPGRVAVLAGVTLVLAAVGVAVALVRPRGRTLLRRPQHAVRRRLAGTALTIAAATAAGTVGNLATDHTFLLAASTAVVVMAVALWLAPSAVSEVAGLAAVGLLAGAVLDEANTAETGVFITLAVVGLAWAALAWTPLLTVPMLGLALGLGMALYTCGVAAFYGQQPEEGIGIAVLVLLVAGGLAGYVRTGRWPLAAAAAVALATLVFRLTSDSLGAPVGLLLTGLALLGAGAVVLLRRRSLDQP
jgi:hypothetical protein